jgi:hypothetical protein
MAATVLAATTGEGADLASVRLVGVGLAIIGGGEYERRWRYSGLSPLGRCGLIQPLW